jgi:CheY-like chemotaxis protein
LDGWQGIAAAERFRPDVIFLDIDMPDLNGYETAKQVREQPWSKKMVLIALTGWAAEERQLTRAAGFDAHLAQAFGPFRNSSAARGL